ncbi:MAG: DM13 domain-containing protein [Pseudomonadota bacterium]
MIKSMSIATLLTMLMAACIAAVTPLRAENTAANADQGKATVVYTAEFTGAGGHVTSGNVIISTKNGKTTVTLDKSFSLDGAPDPKLAFGKDGYVKETIFSKLGKLKGAQTYDVPATLDVADYNELWLWCEKFNVPLGVAKLTKSS